MHSGSLPKRANQKLFCMVHFGSKLEDKIVFGYLRKRDMQNNFWLGRFGSDHEYIIFLGSLRKRTGRYYFFRFASKSQQKITLLPDRFEIVPQHTLSYVI